MGCSPQPSSSSLAQGSGRHQDSSKIYNSVFTIKTRSAQKFGQPWSVLVPCWGNRNPLFDFTSNKSLHLVGFP